MKKTYNVAVTAQQIGSDVVVTLHGGPDVQSLANITVHCPNGTTTTLGTTVGSTYTCSGDGTGGQTE